MSMKTAGILLPSDEILSDKKCDSVSKFLIKELNSLQYCINKIAVIPDNESSIINELDSLIKICDIIIIISDKCSTIYKAIGAMISQDLHQNDDIIKFFKATGERYDKDDVFLPIQAKVIGGSAFPVVHFQRIFIVKEKHLKQTFNKILKNHLMQLRKARQFRKIVKVSQNGSAVSDLNEFSKLTSNGVTVDFSKNDQYFVFKITSCELGDIVAFEEKIREKIEAYRLGFEDASDGWDQVYASEELHVKKSIENIETCLQQYGLDNVFLCFNGGKDCTVLLHLVLTVIKKKFPQHTKPLFCLYVQSDRPFPEQDEFINRAKCYYDLKIITVRNGIKDALEQTLQKFPNYKACFMGTRRTDPYSSELNVFQMTDSNWPQIMRVSPLLDWHYSDIWDYLLYYKVPYCRLYDLGFTSLGNTINTTRNPSLIYHDGGKEVYLPAYKLLKEMKERNGRNAS